MCASWNQRHSTFIGRSKISALGSLVVKLALEHAQYTQGLDKSSQGALKFARDTQKSFDEAGARAKEFMSGIAAGAVGAIASVVGIQQSIQRVGDSINLLASINDAAEKTGSSVDDLSRIEQVSRNFGDSFVAIDTALGRLSRGLAEFKDPSNEAVRALDSIGVATHDSNGELRKAADVYIDVARSLQQYEDGAQKTAVANALFGRTGIELLPAMNNLAAGIDNVRGVSAATTLAADDLKDAMALTRANVDNLFVTMAANLLPTLSNIIAAVNGSSNEMTNLSNSSSIVSSVLKGMVITGYTVIDVFKGVGREIGGRVAQLAALARLDFKSAGFIGDEIAKDSIKAREEYDKFIDTVLSGEQKTAQAVTSGGTKKIIDFQQRMPTAIDATTRSIEKQTKAFDIEVVKLKQYESEAKRARDITASVATKQEIYNQTLEELERLRPYLSVDAYSRALQKAQVELQGTAQVNKTVTSEMGQMWIQTGRNIQSTLANSIFDFFNDGLDGMLRNVKNAVGRIASEFAALKIAQSIGLSSIFGGGSGGTGSQYGGSNLLNIASLGTNALSFVRGGFGIPSVAGAGLGLFGGNAAAFGGGLAGDAIGGLAAGGFTSSAASAASLGASVASFAGPAIVVAAVDQIARLLAGDKMLGGAAGKILNYVPVLGPLINGLFGRGPLKQKSTSLTGNIGADGFQSGFLQTDFVAKGGLFRSDKNDFARIDAVTGAIETDNRKLNEFAAGLSKVSKDVIGLISDTTVQTSAGLRKIGVDLGLSLDGINNFRHTIDLVSEKGEMLSDEQISEEIARITDGLARGLLPEVDSLAKRGETAVQTINRLGMEFSSLAEAAQNLGASAEYAKGLIGSLSIQQRTAFLDNYGGSEQLLSDSASFNQLFLTEAERMAPAIKFVEDGLTSLGFSADLTKDQFKVLVQTLFQSSSEADIATASLLLHNNALFASVADYKAAAKQASDTAAKVGELGQAQESYIDSIIRSIRAMQFDSAANQIALINEEINKLTNFADSLKNTVEQISPQSLDSAKNQIIQATQAAREGKVTDVSAALATLSSQDKSGFTDSFSFARSKAQSVALIDQLSQAISGAISFKQSSIADDLRIASSRARIPAFADGGFHRGGLRIVGERGPELERTGPSQITGNSDLKKSIGNDKVIEELGKLVKILSSVTQGGTAFRTKAQA
ncbi:MAG: hypothetical protein K2Q13_04050 [Nitrosomonas sp.]|uniref:hypothetical protein n=1 Tax=Nitrosomonas sp. TaxID=42353 RepID=UPI0025F1388A|nr:hypothetical protein [Nitrosomonas sp.]MBY0474220.1 hypothetical protein [Nitrosomonas sp.]